LKLSASLPWSSTKGMVSFLISQTISGPMKQPQPPPMAPVTRAPSRADRWASMPQVLASAGTALVPGSAAGGGGGMLSGGVLMEITRDDRHFDSHARRRYCQVRHVPDTYSPATVMRST